MYSVNDRILNSRVNQGHRQIACKASTAVLLSLVYLVFKSTNLLQEQEYNLLHLWGACMAVPRVGSDRWCWTWLAGDWWCLIGRCLVVLSTHWSTADADADAPLPGVFVGMSCIWPLTLPSWPVIGSSDWLVVGRLLLLLLLVGCSAVVGGWMAVWRLELESSLSETLKPALWGCRAAEELWRGKARFKPQE